MNWYQSFMGQKVFERKENTKHNKSCLQDKVCLRTKAESPIANYGTSMHKFQRSLKSCNNLPATTATPYPSPRHSCCTVFHSVAGQRSPLRCKHHFLFTVLVHEKIKIQAWYCLEDKVVLLFDSYFTFESRFRWHRLILTLESTRGIRTLVVSLNRWKKC